MSANLASILYLVSGVLFILALRGLSHPTTSRQGNLYGVCQGSGFSFSRAYYRALSWRFNDTHCIGIVMLAWAELLEAE